MNKAFLAEGATYAFDHEITALDSPQAARLAAQDKFPDVLATARMIALMEIAAARLMQPLLEHDELSVGIGVNIEHLAATPLFRTVTIRATYLGYSDKLHRFELEVRDAGGLVGRGLHSRAIVSHTRLLQGAQCRIDKHLRDPSNTVTNPIEAQHQNHHH